MTPTISDYFDSNTEDGMIIFGAVERDMLTNGEPQYKIDFALDRAAEVNARTLAAQRGASEWNAECAEWEAHLVATADEWVAQDAPRYVVNPISALALATGFVVPLLAAAIAATIIL